VAAQFLPNLKPLNGEEKIVLFFLEMFIEISLSMIVLCILVFIVLLLEPYFIGLKRNKVSSI
jgi:hypothetical protein